MHYKKLIGGTAIAGLALSFSLLGSAGHTKAAIIQPTREELQNTFTEFCEYTSENSIYHSIEALQQNNPKNQTESQLSLYSDTGISIASDYVCVRKAPTTESELLGKLYTGGAATILEDQGDWVKVKSGNLEGYMNKEFLAIGAEAEKVASKYIITKAIVTTPTLKMREKESVSSKTLEMLPEGETCKVKKETDEWAKVSFNGETGYLSKKYITISTSFATAVSIEMEDEKVEEQSADSSKQPAMQTSSNSSNSSLGQRISSYAQRFVGNPYVWGGTSLTSGADCSGFTQSIFRNFGVSIPRDSRSQSGAGRSVSMGNLRKGDLVFYSRNGRINHVAIYIGGGKVISAANEELGVRISSYNYRTPACAKRFI